MSRLPVALVATHLAALGIGYVVAPKQPVDTIVKDRGWFRQTSSRVLTATVESLHDEARLLVFTFKGTAQVHAQTSYMWLFHGSQDLLVPGTANFYVDVKELSMDDVSYDERTQTVTVALPPLTMGDVAFQPEQAMTGNSGVLTFSDGEVEALRKLNYRNARRAIVAQAQQPGLVADARRSAIAAVSSLFEIPLRASGMPDVRVVAKFKI